MDLDTTTAGQAVIRRLLAGLNVTISSTGADTGTGDVQVNGLSSYRNLIRNGNFKINQRLSPAASTSYGARVYSIDGWCAGTSGCTFSQTTTGQDMSVSITAGSLVQIIEPLLVAETTTYVLTYEGTATARVYQNTSSPGAYSAGARQVSLTQGQATYVEFTGGTVTRVQLEIGIIGMPRVFERNPLEQLRCDRHYLRLYPSVRGSSATVGCFFQFPLPMYTTPTMSLVTAGTRSSGLTGVFVSAINTEAGVLNIQGPAGSDNFVQGDTWQAIAELAIP